MRRGRLTWIIIFALVIGAIVGTILEGILSGSVPVLTRGISIGIDPPFTLDLNALTFTFGFTLRLNLAGGLVALLIVLLLGR
ncbi:MAG TPA: DUF4321 domain-containing protein [Firmicutes bacterium]|nr:DUF4321 domain-containing protein [Candidatus Fermentithermobacillaceae bacterium]